MEHTLNENNEPLVDINKECPKLVVKLVGQANKRAYLRKSVAEMLCQATYYLPKGVTFVINDAWRSKDEQAEIAKNFEEYFRRKHPKWNKKKVQTELQKFVAPFRGKKVSGHMTGGAVDLRLIKNERRIPMRSRKLNYQENALSYQPKLSKHLQDNRQIMFSALKKAGLSNYHREFWHWSYGDYQWAKRNKKPRYIYGPTNI